MIRTLLLCLCMAAPSAWGAAFGLHYGADGTVDQYIRFEEWIGRKITHRVTFADKNTWNDIRSPWPVASGATAQWLARDPDNIEVLTVPLRIASGTFAENRTADFEALGNRIKAFGARVILRLGWEANGNWYVWNYINDVEGYKAAFRAAVAAIRRNAPACRIDWCVSYRQTKIDWRLGYPGDDVVDIISMDVYDWVSSWQDLRDGVCGLRELREFASARGKLEAYPEWGLNSSGNGDNASFVANMAAWFKLGNVLYQGYWNHSDVGAVIFSPSGAIPNPQASAEFRKLFGSPFAPSINSAQ